VATWRCLTTPWEGEESETVRIKELLTKRSSRRGMAGEGAVMTKTSEVRWPPVVGRCQMASVEGGEHHW
jgi:hypothetical protein